MFAALSTDGQPDLKTAIISLLARNPLGARDVHSHVLKEYSFDVSYQGVHKALSQLLRREVLRKNGARYSLSKDWVVGVKEFLCDIEEACIYQRPAQITDLAEYASVTIKNTGPIAEPYLWMLDQAHRIRSAKPLDAVCFQRRAWPLLVFAGKHYHRFKRTFRDREQYVLVEKQSGIDKYLSALWKESGFRCRLGVPSAEKGETLVCGDFVFQLFNSERTNREWDRFYALLAKGTSEGLIAAHRLAFETCRPAEVVVTRNAEFADRLRERARQKFKT